MMTPPRSSLLVQAFAPNGARMRAPCLDATSMPLCFLCVAVALQVRCKSKPVRRCAKCGRRYHMRTPHRQSPFWLVRKLLEHSLRAKKAKNRVAKELKALVVMRRRMIHPIRRCGQRLLKKRLVREGMT